MALSCGCPPDSTPQSGCRHSRRAIEAHREVSVSTSELRVILIQVLKRRRRQDEVAPPSGDPPVAGVSTPPNSAWDATASSTSSPPQVTAADERKAAPLIVRPIVTDFWSDEHTGEEVGSTSSVDSAEDIRLAPGASLRPQIAASGVTEPITASGGEAELQSPPVTLDSDHNETATEVPQSSNLSAQGDLEPSLEASPATIDNAQMSGAFDGFKEVQPTNDAAVDQPPQMERRDATNSGDSVDLGDLPIQMDSADHASAQASITVDTLALSDIEDLEEDEDLMLTQIETEEVDDVIRIHLTFVEDEVSKIEIVGTGNDAQEWINAAERAEQAAKKKRKKKKKKKKRD